MNHSSVLGILDEILADVANAADKLEKKLGNHMFDDYARKPNKVMKVLGINISQHGITYKSYN